MMNCTAAERTDLTDALYGEYDVIESVGINKGADLSGVNFK